MVMLKLTPRESCHEPPRLHRPDAASNSATGTAAHRTHASDFPWSRLFFAIAFSIAAYFVLWVVFITGGIQFILRAINGDVNEELRGFSANLVQWFWEIVAYVTWVREEKPFPFAPFPRVTPVAPAETVTEPTPGL